MSDSSTCPACGKDSAECKCGQDLTPFVKLLEKALPAFLRVGEKLKAAGIADPSAEDFWVRLLAFAKVDARCTREEFLNMSPFEMEAIVDRYLLLHGRQLETHHVGIAETPEENSNSKNLKRELKAIDDAIETLGSKASTLSICEWIDKNRQFPCDYAPQRSDRKWTTAYHRGSKKALEEQIRRRRRAYEKCLQ